MLFVRDPRDAELGLPLLKFGRAEEGSFITLEESTQTLTTFVQLGVEEAFSIELMIRTENDLMYLNLNVVDLFCLQSRTFMFPSSVEFNYLNLRPFFIPE